MDWKAVLSQLSDTYDDNRLEEIFNELILLDESKKFDTKQYKKLYRLCLYVLRLKSRQINELQSEINEMASERIQPKESTDMEEISKLTTIIERLEVDKAHYKVGFFL